MKYPIGIQSFDQIREDGYVYVDKTGLIYNLVTQGKTYFLSRPRRFGKSLLVSTLACYFQGRKDLFAGLEIDGLEKDWYEYPIFRIDFNGGLYTQPGILEATIEGYLGNWEDIYGKNPNYTTIGTRFIEILRRAYEQTGRRAVVLIDEYDKPILDVLDTEACFYDDYGKQVLLENHNREILKSFYSTFKGADQYLRFVLLTGVTKFSQVSVFSGFNQPKDISMDERYEALCGITQNELEAFFEEPTIQLAAKYQYTVKEMKELLRRQYDGYHFGERMTDIYNPFSILNAFDSMAIRDYWFSTGTPTYLVRLLQHSREQINELAGRYYVPSLFVDYKADVEQPLPMIYQSGYLTIKEYDRDFQIYTLAYPNKEVRKGFIESLMPAYVHLPARENTFYVVSFIKDLRVGNLDQCMERIKSFFASIPNDMNNKEEKHYQTIFYLLFRLMGQYVDAEVKSAVGRADVVIKMQDAIYVFEFKVDGTPEEALAQINSKQYAIPYQADHRKVIKVGVNFDSSMRTIGEWIIEN